MLLRSAPTSPYARKVRLAAAILKLDDRIEVAATDTNADKDLTKLNPLGKIPVLVLDNGQTLFNSRVILEYLDHLAGTGRIIPREAEPRFAALRLQALCDGIMDASLLQIYEARYRPAELHHKPWLEMQAGKVGRGLAALENDPPALGAMPDVGRIALACALGYLDLRFKGEWRKSHPQLVAWLDRFAEQVPAYAATKVEA